MSFIVPSETKHLLILGAGSSVDYGLPIWVDLSNLIQKKLEENEEGKYVYKEEILAWINKVGEKKEYATIDECVYEESVSEAYSSNGDEVENEIFSIIKEIFKELYRENNLGWIKTLNEKILSSPDLKLEGSLSFISYNYDDVLDKNLLNYKHLPRKQLRWTYKTSLEHLSESDLPVLYAHGNLYSEEELDKNSHVSRCIETMKTGDENVLDVVTCFESNKHSVRRYDFSRGGINLYILGLGGGLQMNLNNITLEMPVSQIHVTIREESKRADIIKYLSEKYKKTPAEINVYDSCEDLIKKCFNNF